MGAISTVVAIMAVERAVTLARICRILGARWSDLRLVKDVGKIAVAAAIAGCVAAGAHALMTGWKPFFVLAAGSTVLAASYTVAVIVLRVPAPEEIALIRENAMRVLRRLS
jgi:hypothetical protein